MINPMSLNGRTIVVTGAASGIGRECAVLMNQMGAKLVLLDKDEDGLHEVKEIIKSSNIPVVTKTVDLLGLDEINTVLIDAKRQIGSSYTGLVHCAGIPSVIPLRALSYEQYEKVMRINTDVGLVLAKAFSSRQGHDVEKQGAIVFISSVYGVVGSAANVAYATSKAALIGMTKSLAVELSRKNIRVNCVVPGFVKTNMADDVNQLFDAKYADRIEKMHLLGWGDTIDIANMITYLISDAAKWITGAVFNVDGGFTAQ